MIERLQHLHAKALAFSTPENWNKFWEEWGRHRRGNSGGIMATNYQRGYRAEIKVRKHLEAKGWRVTRSGGSKGPADLVAFRFHIDTVEILFVQVKRNMKVPGKEMKTFLKAFPPGEYYAKIKIAGATVRDRKPGIEFEYHDGEPIT